MENKGTGQHPHKSSEDPRPHHEAPTTSGQGSSSRGSSSQSGQHASSGGSQSSSRSSGSSRSQSNEDLNSREYKGPDGQEHHHTKTYMEQHKKSA
jgi:hypothetical protein